MLVYLQWACGVPRLNFTTELINDYMIGCYYIPDVYTCYMYRFNMLAVMNVSDHFKCCIHLVLGHLSSHQFYY